MSDWEPAAEIDIQVMEQLAVDRVRNIPAEVQKRYGYITEVGSCAIFQTRGFEEDEGLSMYPAIILAKPHFDSVRFSLTFGPNNIPNSLYYPNEGDLDVAAGVAQDLIEENDIREDEKAVLRHAQALIFGINGTINIGHLGVMAAIGNKEPQHVAEVIRDLVNANTSFAVMTKRYELPFDDSRGLQISEHKVLGDVTPHEVVELPRLQIIYEDQADKSGWSYVKEQDGKSRLEPVDERFNNGEEMSTPGRAGIQFLTDKLIEAAILELAEVE